MIILAIDPGWEWTGFALLDTIKKTILTTTMHLKPELDKHERLREMAGFATILEERHPNCMIMEDFDPRKDRITGAKTMFVMGYFLGAIQCENKRIERNRTWAAWNEQRIKAEKISGYRYIQPDSEHEADALKMALAYNYRLKLEEEMDDHPF